MWGGGGGGEGGRVNYSNFLNGVGSSLGLLFYDIQMFYQQNVRINSTPLQFRIEEKFDNTTAHVLLSGIVVAFHIERSDFWLQTI